MTTDLSLKLHQTFRDLVAELEFLGSNGETRWDHSKVEVNVKATKRQARKDLAKLVAIVDRVLE